jgi:hypothetical protein
MPGGKKLIVDEVEAFGHLGRETPGSDLWSRSASMTKRLRAGTLDAVPEPALFQAHNVIGATGLGGPSPSVYYRSGDTFSHVTTDHPKPTNIGRSKVRTYSDYHIGNTGNRGQSQEFYNGRVRHTSRQPFTPVQNEGEQQRMHVAAQRFPDPKTKY